MDEGPAAEFWFDLAPAPITPPFFDAAELARLFRGSAPRRLGSGTYGETWLVTRDAALVAAKIIHYENYSPQRLRREVGGLQLCASPHVVKLLGVDSVRLKAKDRSVLFFEFISGADANEQMLKKWPSPEEIVAFARGVSRGLHELHRNGVLHRDIKFGNIALRSGRWAEPVILDLGLARILDESSLTTYPRLLGTLPFMSPEQVRGERARKGSDLWALGVMLYVLLARRHPFYGDYAKRLSRTDAVDRLMSGPMPLASAPSPEFVDLVLRLLSSQLYRRGSTTRVLRELDEHPK